MALNRFNIIILIQILLIAGLGMLVALTLGHEYMRMTTAGLLIVWLGQIVFLNYYMNRIHRDVRKFMGALKNQDTSQFFSSRKEGKYFRELYKSFNEITRDFRLVSIEKEVENQFYRETIAQAASGMLAVADDGSISLINEAALNIFGIEDLQQASELEKIHPGMARILSGRSAGDHHQLRIQVKGRWIQIAVKTTEMILQGTRVSIFSLLDITREMTRNELEAWQKLIRVLNHEITNSVTPIHILSSSLLDLFQLGTEQKSPEEIDEEVIGRTILGLKTIVKRSGGLSDFINTYRSFSRTDKPDRKPVRLTEMIHQILSLLAGEIETSGVTVTSDIKSRDLRILADEKLIEQTIINLVKNSIHATEGIDNPVIHIMACNIDDQISIEITDNGKGIPEEIIEHVFTPFFTTRKGGSGIGLSLARQVMQMHNGSINVNSPAGENTTFTLSFAGVESDNSIE